MKLSIFKSINQCELFYIKRFNKFNKFKILYSLREKRKRPE